MVDYSAAPNKGTEEVLISAIKEGDCFIAERHEGMFKALKDAYLSDDGGSWIVEAEDEDFETKIFAVTKSNLAYAPKMGRVY